MPLALSCIQLPRLTTTRRVSRLGRPFAGGLQSQWRHSDLLDQIVFDGLRAAARQSGIDLRVPRRVAMSLDQEGPLIGELMVEGVRRVYADSGVI